MRACLLAVFLAVVLAAPLAAHHGWSGYRSEEFDLEGTLERDVASDGAHATMRLRAVDGQVWDLTLAPPARTQQAGLRAGLIPAGAKIRAHGHRHVDPKRFEVKTERVTWNGRTFNVYPDRS